MSLLAEIRQSISQLENIRVKLIVQFCDTNDKIAYREGDSIEVDQLETSIEWLRRMLVSEFRGTTEL